MKRDPSKPYQTAEKLELPQLKKEFPKVFRKISCPSCESEVPVDNVNLQNSLAKCAGCQVIFSIESEVEAVKSKKEIRQQVLRPEGIDLFYFKEELDITIDQHVQGMDAFMMMISVMAAFLSIMIYFAGKVALPPFIPIGLTMLALYYGYKGVTYSKNKIYITVNDQYLNIQYRPKNFNKDRSFRSDEIDQVYLKPSAVSYGHYDLHLIINAHEGQKHVKLLSANSLTKATFLEQEIEKYLGIEDREVLEAKAFGKG